MYYLQLANICYFPEFIKDSVYIDETINKPCRNNANFDFSHYYFEYLFASLLERVSNSSRNQHNTNWRNGQE